MSESQGRALFREASKNNNPFPREKKSHAKLFLRKHYQKGQKQGCPHILVIAGTSKETSIDPGGS